MAPCRNPACPANVNNVAQHLHRSPLCRRFYAVDNESQQEPPHDLQMLPQQTEDDDMQGSTFYQKMRRNFMNSMNDMHYRERVGPTKCDKEAGRAISFLDAVQAEAAQVVAATPDPNQAAAAITGVFEAARHALMDLHSSARRDKYNREVAKVPYVEPLLFKSLSTRESKADAIHFDLIDLTARILQHDAEACVRPRLVIGASTPRPHTHAQALLVLCTITIPCAEGNHRRVRTLEKGAPAPQDAARSPGHNRW